MTLLITADELEIHLGATFTAAQTTRATQIIGAVSAVVQGYCNRVQLVAVTDDEITLHGSYSYRLPLPLGPVTSVSSVTVDGYATTAYDLVQDTLVRSGFDDQPPFRHPSVPHWGGPDVEVAVTYSHGLSAVPDKVKAVAFDLAARPYANPTSVRSQSIDGYSVTFAGQLSGSSALSLSADQMKTLKGWHISNRSART
jgi:hypothetical protein